MFVGFLVDYKKSLSDRNVLEVYIDEALTQVWFKIVPGTKSSPPVLKVNSLLFFNVIEDFHLLGCILLALQGAETVSFSLEHQAFDRERLKIKVGGETEKVSMEAFWAQVEIILYSILTRGRESNAKAYKQMNALDPK